MKVVTDRTGTANLDFLSPYFTLPRDRLMFIYRFDQSLPGWSDYDESLATFTRHNLRVDPEAGHVRFVHSAKAVEKLVMDRVHLDDEGSPFQGILSGFHIVNHDGDRQKFVHTFETRLADPGDWPGRHGQVETSTKTARLTFHPMCDKLVPVFYVARDNPEIAVLEDFVIRLRQFAERFPMHYDPDAARFSIPHDSRYDE